MGYEWIFDVLRDLKSFAHANDMPALADKADEAIAAARAEIEARGESSPPKPEEMH